MSTFPHILPTVSRDGQQNGDLPANVSTAAAGLTGLFADVMAQALSPAPKESVSPTRQQTGENVGKNEQPLKARPLVEAGKFYNSEILPRQVVAANVLNNASAWPATGMQKPISQPGTHQSDSSIAAKNAGKPNESFKTNRDSQAPADQTGVFPVQPEIPINQMVAVAVPAMDLIPKSLPVSTPGATSAAPQRPGMDIGPVAYQAIPVQSKSPAQSKSVSSAPAASADSLKNGIVAGQPAAASVAVRMTTEAADAVATNAESLLKSAKFLAPEAKPNTNNGRASISEAPSSDQQPVAQTSTDLSGMSIAKQDISVNQADKTNNIAGQTEKVLPGNTVLGAQGNSPLPGSVHMEQVAATVPAAEQAPSNSSAAGVSVQAAPVASVSNTGSLERTQEMITVNAVRLSDSGNNAMQVVIKPDAGTQLSLELRQHGAGVEVQAVLQQGDFNHLSQQWADLQQRLTQRGIQLAPLADNAAGAYNGGGESFQQKQQQPAEPAGELHMTGLSARPVVPTIVHAPLISHEPAQQGWETWA